MPEPNKKTQEKEKMAKVGAKCGMTLKLFKDSQYEFIRPEVSIDDIDTNGDVEEQLKVAVMALNDVWETVTEEVNKKIIAEIPRVDAEMQLQVSKKLKNMELLITSLQREVESLKDKGPRLPTNVAKKLP